MLNERQKRFCEYYVACGNAAEAARKAGYSVKTARHQGYRLLTNEHIALYIRELTDGSREKRIAKAIEVLEFYTRVMRGEEKDIFDVGPTLDDRIKAASYLLRMHDVADRAQPVEDKLDAIFARLKDAILNGSGDFSE